MTLQEIQQEAREVMDDEYRGLKQTSNTNKTRMEILGLVDEAFQAGKDAAVGYIEKEIWKRGTYDLNYDDIYKEARNAV